MEIAQDGENLVQRLDPGTADPPGNERSPSPSILVAAQGLPNLLHELVHAVQAQRLDDDHGIDYGAIPFSLETYAGRAVLWDELACCVISCAYLWAHGRAARAGAPSPAVRAEVEAWFREQVDIQPVFYGMEDQPQAFGPRVRSLLHEHEAEAEAVLDRAYAATERALAQGGAGAVLAAPPRRPRMSTLWSAWSPPEPVEHA